MNPPKRATESAFRSLLANDLVTEELHLASRVGIMAFHGGVEQRTERIARNAAELAAASLYVVDQPEDLGVHVPSHRISPDESPSLRQFIDHVDVALAVHGYGRPHMFRVILIGGSNDELREICAAALMRELPHYEIRHKLAEIPRELRGQHPLNPVNLPRLGGVQIELPPRVRGLSPLWQPQDEAVPVPHEVALTRALAEAVAQYVSVSSD
jgi:phage replication-related protein YjqB (UPF0714/DUF867 family)